MKAFGIFEGGGAKGLAHVGALRACEDYGVEFCGVAGASAGAIVAALAAACYRSSELFDPSAPGNSAALFSGDFRKLIKSHPAEDRVSWPEFQDLADDIASLSKSTWPKARLAWLWFKHARLRGLCARRKGLFDPESFAAILDGMLERKLLGAKPGLIAQRGFGTERRAGERYRVMFADLPIPLKIVATDLLNGRVVEFSATATPGVPVAQAVAASIAIPLFFTPVTIQATAPAPSFLAVDGGVISNFPAWLFDKERHQTGPHIPTLGFKLVVDEKAPDRLADGGLFPYIRRLLGVAVTGDPILETRQIDNLREVPLRVSASTLDFDLPPAKKVALFGEGYACAQQVFGTPGFPVEADTVRQHLQALVDTVRAGAGRGPEVPIRACVVCPTTRDTLRVTYTCGMDGPEDTDDQLELGMDVGGAGKCWQEQALTALDMSQAQTTYSQQWRMTKYQQALVRKDIQALVCWPISSASAGKLGVLSLDSTDGAILVYFQSDETRAMLWSVAGHIARIMERGVVGEMENL